MGATGDVVTVTRSEQVGLRCPIGECHVVEANPSSAVALVAGTPYRVSNLLVIALRDRTATASDPLIPCAYEIPKLAVGSAFNVGVRASETWAVGARLGMKIKSNILVAATGSYTVVAHALEAKAANASSCLVHFKGMTSDRMVLSS